MGASIDIIFNCPHCEGSLAADSQDVGLSVSCPHCRHSITIPCAENVTDDTDRPGVRRLTRQSQPASAHSDEQYEALAEAYAQNQAELAALRIELEKTRTQEAETMDQIDARIQDLQKRLDLAIQRLAIRDEEYETLKLAVGHLESAAMEVLRHLSQKRPVPVDSKKTKRKLNPELSAVRELPSS